MAAIGNRSKEIAIMGKKLVKNRVLGNNSHESTGPSRGIHSSVYDKNPEGYIQPALVPDEVVNSTLSSNYWAPHPETGVFVPRTANSLEHTANIVNSEGRKMVMEEKAWFRPTGLEDLERPPC